MSDWPEHEKVIAIQERSQALGAFLDTTRYTLCEWRECTLARWLDERTGTELTPRGNRALALAPHTVENPDWFPTGYHPVRGTINQILAEHFEIDLDRLEEEKHAMLDAIREANARR